MVGAHLDSVPAGPSVKDNGSGTAAILETALQMQNFSVRNKVRFAFWAGEELGLLGSDQYVEGQSAAEREKISLYLNIAIGIPAGGIFTGAEGIKTPAEQAMFGGTAGVANDVCHHQAFDTIANVNVTAFDVNADAIAVRANG